MVAIGSQADEFNIIAIKLREVQAAVSIEYAPNEIPLVQSGLSLLSNLFIITVGNGTFLSVSQK